MIELMTLNQNAINLRKKFGEDDSSPIDVMSIVQNLDEFTLLFFPFKGDVSGMCIRETNNKMIVVNSNHSLGRIRFTIAHELCHLYYHDSITNRVCPAEIEKQIDNIEKEANVFASYFLAPFGAFNNFIRETLKKNKNIDILCVADVLRIENYFGMSRMATLFRLKQEGYQFSWDNLSTNVKKEASLHGYQLHLYDTLPLTETQKSYGKYVRQVIKLKNEEKLKVSKFEEILLDGFRSDMIYEDYQDEEDGAD